TFLNDVLGRMTQETDPTGALFTWAYNGAGLETSEKDALGHTTSLTWNSRGEETKRVEALGTASERSFLSSYNTAGEETGERDANGYWDYTGYDADSDPSSETDALGGKRLELNDLDGEVYEEQDELGRPTDYGYDPMGRVKTVKDALGNV